MSHMRLGDAPVLGDAPAPAKGKSDPGLTEADGTGAVASYAAAPKGKSDPGLTEADGTGAVASSYAPRIMATTAKGLAQPAYLPPTSTSRPRSAPASSFAQPPLPPPPPPVAPRPPPMPPPRPHVHGGGAPPASAGPASSSIGSFQAAPGSAESAKRRRMAGWQPGDSHGRSEQGAKDRAGKQEKRWQAHLQKQSCRAAARAEAIAAGLPPPPPPAPRLIPPQQRACVQCKYNEFAKDCDYEFCGKCCRAQKQGTWCSYHKRSTG